MDVSVSLGRSSLFHDVETFNYLKHEVLPPLLAQAQEQQRDLRLWSAGCGSGEDPYALAMLLIDLLGSHPLADTFTIFATDEDERMLAHARRGVYPAHQLVGFPEGYRERFFARLGEQYCIPPVVRARVIFGSHELRTNVPFPRLDLVVCRHGWSSLESGEQRDVCARWAYVLSARRGFLFLGQLAAPASLPDALFECLSPTWHWYRSVEAKQSREPLHWGTISMTPNEKRIEHPWSGVSPQRSASAALATFSDAITCLGMNFPMGVMLLDRTYHLLACNPLARQLLTLPEPPWEHPPDFLHAARGLPYAQVRQAIDTTFQMRMPLTLPEVKVGEQEAGGQRCYVSLFLTPLVADEERPELLLLCVAEVTAAVSMQQELARLQATYALTLEEQRRVIPQLREKLVALEAADQLLLVDNAHLAADVEQGLLLQEELAIFNEELQVTNEELRAQSQARQELEHLNLLKDEFLSLASHELRTPLTVILGHAELLQRHASSQGTESGTTLWSGQRQREGLLTILTQAKQLSRLIEQMLDVIRIRGDVFALQPTAPLDLVALVRRVVEQYQVTSGTRLLFETEEDTLICPGDAGRIEQVCANLISNALKYSPSSMPVVVTLKRELTGILLPQALIAVQDQGPGIRPDAQADIFRRFYREPGTQQRYVEGLGLGLYVAHEIVTRHGGRLWVESTVGVGSTFYVALPVAGEMAVKERA